MSQEEQNESPDRNEDRSGLSVLGPILAGSAAGQIWLYFGPSAVLLALVLALGVHIWNIGVRG